MTIARLLTTADAAAALNVTPACLDAWRRRHRGPRWRQIGRLIRYAEDDLQVFVTDAIRDPLQASGTPVDDGLLSRPQRKETA